MFENNVVEKRSQPGFFEYAADAIIRAQSRDKNITSLEHDDARTLKI